MAWDVLQVVLSAVNGVTAAVTIRNGFGKPPGITTNLRMLPPDYTWMAAAQLPTEPVYYKEQAVPVIISCGRL